MPENLTITRNKIPKTKNYFRGPVTISYRQALSKAFKNFKPSIKNSILNSVIPDNDTPVNPLINGLVSYWKLDSGFPGNSPDSVGVCPVTGGLEATIVAGKVNNSGHLVPSGGGSSSVGVGSGHPEFLFSSTNFSIAQWVRFTTDPGLDVNFITNGSSLLPEGWPRGFQVAITAVTKKIFAGVGKASVWKETIQTVGLSLATWYFYVATFNLSNNLITLRVFDSSSLLDTVTAVAGRADYDTDVNNEQLRIANSRFASGFQYDFDETGIWNRVLTDAEILTLWNNGNGRTYPFN